MRRLLIAIITVFSTVSIISAETISVSLSLNSMTIETSTHLLRPGETLTIDCRFTADVSSGTDALKETLNSELLAAGITTLEIFNIRQYTLSTKPIYNLTLKFSPLATTPIRIFNITTASATHTITLALDTDGVLNTYLLQGKWVNNGSDNFTLSLTGSQHAVTYNLQKDSTTIITKTGTGSSLNFGQFNGIESHGTYRVLAQYKDWPERIVGTITMIRKQDMGGNNYTAVRTYTKADGSTSYTDVTYYNGLGYPEQEIMVEGASDNMNLVKPIVYDNMMRAGAKEYIPYPSTEKTAAYIEDVLTAHKAFFHEEERPFVENTFESGASGRLLTSQKPGQIYEERSKKASIKYGINDGNERIIEFRYDYAGSGTPASVTPVGSYAKERLLYTMSISEDNDTSLVFSDTFGKTVLNRKVSDGINHDTYFIYDLKDSLVCVIQPQGTAQISGSFTFDDAFCSNYCFTYQYDERGNIIEKQVPGGGKDVMAYDMRNRMILSADAYMQTIGKYRYVLYDSMDRVTEEGYASITTSIEAIRNSQRGNVPVENFLTDKFITRRVSYYTSGSAPSPTIPTKSNAYHQGVDVTHCITLPAVEILYEEPYYTGTVLSSSGFSRTRKYFYDSKGRITLMNEIDSDGWGALYSWKNDFAGNVVRHTEEHYKGTVFDSMVTVCTYDKRGRRIGMNRALNGTQYASVSYSYDDFGRIRVKDVSGRGTEVYGYNLQGWQESSAANFYGYEVFSQTMNYMIPFMALSVPRHDGLISEIRSQHLNQDIQTIGYYYDGLQRLKDTNRYCNWDQAPQNIWTEKSISYDRNGNILSLDRYGESSDSTIEFLYEGNHIARASHGGTASYTYYPNGNIKADGMRGLQFKYNMLNLPAIITDISGQTGKAMYRYLPDGTKIQTFDGQGEGRKYRGNFVYTVDVNGTETLESIAHDEGRFIAMSSTSSLATRQFIDTWHIRDHLGSVRAILDITRDTAYVKDPSLVILEQNDYLPFGARVNPDSLAYDQSNRYRFNGKEEQVLGNLGLYDYGARFYDNLYPHWTTPDPLAEEFYSISPYAFCNNNPINYVDPDGRLPDIIWDVASIGMGISNLVQNVQSGNARGAVGDGVGIVIDAVAAAVPFIPGGVGAVRAGAKAVNAIDNAADAAKTIERGDNIIDNTKGTTNLQKTAEIGKEAHRQIERELIEETPGTKTEVTIKLGEKIIRKDAVKPDGTAVIIKPNTPSGHQSAVQRERLMQNNGYKTETIFYNPKDPKWLPESPTYIGPKK